MDFTRLFSKLSEYRGLNVFNQYAEVDPEFDIPGADKIRRDNLIAYMEIFRDARYILVGEAPSFYGCRFSGIHFTSEELIMGENPLPWARGKGFKKTSHAAKPMKEHSATIVWGQLAARNDVILWNAFPWHTYKQSEKNKNRKPTEDELAKSVDVLRTFLALYPGRQIYAIGRTAEFALGNIGVEAEYIRHPANGGKPKFVDGIKGIGQMIQAL